MATYAGFRSPPSDTGSYFCRMLRMSCKLYNWVNQKRSIGGDLPHPHGSSQTKKKPGGGSRAKHGTSIPKGDALLSGVDTDVLREMHAEMSGCKDAGKEALIIAAAIKWWERLDVSVIARQLLQPRSTVRDWLARLRNRRLGGISDRTAPNHKSILDEVACLVIGVWLSHVPQAYGPESACGRHPCCAR